MEMEDTVGANSLRYPFPGAFEFSDGEQKTCLGFMELLGVQDYSLGASQFFDMLQTTSPSSLADPDFTFDTVKETPEIWNHWPATPNSSSISSTTSSEAVNDEQQAEQNEDGDKQRQQEPKKSDKQLKAKKTNQKKQKEPRFAFMTKSEVDHLEDGYRWRKYGQKAVKNSPYPRSYYRCTSVACNVKKRVERCLNDPSIVVTTYEGQHTHPSPVMARSSYLAPPNSTALYGGYARTAATSFSMSVPAATAPSLYHYQNALNLDCHPNGFTNAGSSFHHERRLARSIPSARAAAQLLAADHGLLEDAIPSNIRSWAE